MCRPVLLLGSVRGLLLVKGPAPARAARRGSWVTELFTAVAGARDDRGRPEAIWIENEDMMLDMAYIFAINMTRPVTDRLERARLLPGGGFA